MKVKLYKKHYIKNNKCLDCKKTISDNAKRCSSCAKRGNKHGFINGDTKKQYYCIDCNKKISYQTFLYGNKRCRSCSNSLSMLKILKKGIKYHPTYIDGRSLKKHLCEFCGKSIHWQSIRCQSCYWIYLLPELMKGKNHPNWQNGISKLPYAFEFNKKLKELIKIRDNYRCQLCNKTGTHIHHIDYNKLNCKERNLITLCSKCNPKVNFNRDFWYAYFTYLMEKV
jgi:hypothetical protein